MSYDKETHTIKAPENCAFPTINDEMIKQADAIVYLAAKGYSIFMPGSPDMCRIISAAQDLVDAVERYVKQDCLRSELLNKTKELKKLL